MKDNISAFNSSEYDYNIKRTVPYYEDFYKQVIEVVQIYNQNPLTWLDVGCGSGKMAETALEQLNIEKFVFCDSSSEMIALAKKHFDFSNTDFLVSDVQNLNFNNTFDVVTAIQVNHYLHKSERITAIKKCFDALKENGLFISFENFAPFTDLGTKLYLNRWQSYQCEQGKSIAESKQHIDRYNKEYFPITLSEHMEVMKDCGFKAVEILWLSYMQVGILGIK